MRIRRRWLVLVGLPLAGFVLYKLIYPTFEWSQRLTLHVETDAGAIEASGVVVKTVSLIPQILPDAASIRQKLRGEATALEVPGRGFIFALLGNAEYIANNVFKDMMPDSSARAYYSTFQNLNATREVPRKFFPLLVTFADINDPKTVKRVDPDDMDAALGCERDTGPKPWRDAGMLWRDWVRWQATDLTREQWDRQSTGRMFGEHNAKKFANLPERRDTTSDCTRLTDITLTIGDEAATVGNVQTLLPWLCDLKARLARLNGKTGPIMERDLADNLGTGHFATGDCT